MTKTLITLALLLCHIFLTSCAQISQPTTAEIFLNYLNKYQIDSLKNLVADNFQLTRTYATYTNDKKSFIDKYVPNSKSINGKYRILETTCTNRTTDFLVEDESDFLKYLNIVPPKWRLKIVLNEQQKIELMNVDTAENYSLFEAQIREKSEQFESWLSQKYPGETLNGLYGISGLLTQRLKEYSNK